MQILENGTKVPTNGDPYNLTDDLAEMGITAGTVYKVPDQATRDALTTVGPGSVVSRTDLPCAPLETYDGTRWSVSDADWALLPMAQAFNHHTSDGWSGLKFAVRNGWVIVTGAVSRATAWDTGVTCAVVPGPICPTTRIQGTNNAYVGPEGNVSLAAGSSAVSIYLAWPLF